MTPPPLVPRNYAVTPEEIGELIDRSLSLSSSPSSMRYTGDPDDRSNIQRLMCKMFERHREMLQELKQKHRESVQQRVVNTVMVWNANGLPSQLSYGVSTEQTYDHAAQETVPFTQQLEESVFCVLDLPSDDDEYFDVVVSDLHGMKELFYDCQSIPLDGSDGLQAEDQSIGCSKEGELETQTHAKNYEFSEFHPEKDELSSSREDQDGSLRRTYDDHDGLPSPSMDDSEQRILDHYLSDGIQVDEEQEDILLSTFDELPSPPIHDTKDRMLDGYATTGTKLDEWADDLDHRTEGSGDPGVLSLADLVPYEVSSEQKTVNDVEHESNYLTSEIEDILDNMFDEFKNTGNVVDDAPAVSSDSTNFGNDHASHIISRRSFDESKISSSPAQPVPRIEARSLEESSGMSDNKQDAIQVLDDFFAVMESMDEESNHSNEEVTENYSTQCYQNEEDVDLAPCSVVSSTSSKSSEMLYASTSSSSSKVERTGSKSSNDTARRRKQDDNVDDRASVCSSEEDLVSDDGSELDVVTPKSSEPQHPLTIREGIEREDEGVVLSNKQEQIDAILGNLFETMDELSTQSKDKDVTVSESMDVATVGMGSPGKKEFQTIDNGTSKKLISIHQYTVNDLFGVSEDVIASECPSPVDSAVRGESSVFSSSVPRLVADSGMAREFDSVPSSNRETNPTDAEKGSANVATDTSNEISFASLHETERRITAPESKISFATDSQHQCDPVAACVSVNSMHPDQHIRAGKIVSFECDDHEKSSGLEKSEAIVDSMNEDVTNTRINLDEGFGRIHPISPPRPCRQTEFEFIGANLHESPSGVDTSRSRIPSFDQHSVSTLSASPVSTRIFETNSLEKEQPSIPEVPAFEECNDRENDPSDTLNDFKNSPLRLELSVKRPNSDMSTPARAPAPSAYDPTVPFSNINHRMDQQKHRRHVASTPHVVPTSRSPFRGETFSACRSLLSAGDKSALQSLRGYYSLASPPRTPVTPQVATVSRTPRETPHPLSPAMAATPKSPYHQPTVVCTNKFKFDLHSRMGPCDRCWALASPGEQDWFERRGSHLRIVRTRGGCDYSCTIFPPKGNIPARLCRQCFFATHQRDGSRVQVYRGNHIKVKLTT
ncbi:hypothetical protein IV203_026142 [Nitzschia inconspicua]|uniref:Uncharacterized protein n=1 Tax=Nitzschia inconspicua TaxID=303405 RepID=A0A9K3LIQ6_9STRA|nr:hypothetical protein IV203_026142 [Nitzschia inconspicua]